MKGATAGRSRSRVLRCAATLAAVVLAVVGLPGVAGADPPSTTVEMGASINCELDDAFFGVFVGEFAEDGDVFRFVDVFFDDFAGGQFIFGSTEEFDFDGTTLSAEVEMELEAGGPPEPVGIATISATLTPVGEPETSEDRFRDGNVWVHERITFQPAEAAGSAVLDGFFDFDLGQCFGDVFETETTMTNPNAFVGRSSGQFLECFLEGPEAGFGFLFADTTDNDTFADLFIVAPDGAELGGFTEDFTLNDSEASGVIQLIDFAAGMPAGEAVISGALTEDGTFIADVTAQNVRVKFVETSYEVVGTVDVNGDSYEMVDCFSQAFNEKLRFTDPNGPKPSGKTPANDLPGGAVSLDDRRTTNAQTKAAGDFAEAECVVSFSEDGEEFEFSVPLGKTLWYTFEGTGGPVTIDTAGSNYDTVLGIYDTDLNQLACNDDVGDESGFTLQAAATIDTTAGTTYLVQIGGFGLGVPDFPAEYGRARIKTS